MQITNSILMIRPVNFFMNQQTAVNNYFQESIEGIDINQKAQLEFDGFVKSLREVGVQVIVVDDTMTPETPDSIFPNNWVSFHEDASVGLYPMFAKNRRLERREDILELLESKSFLIENVIDYTSAEEEELYLEGTGSIILDRENKKAYCALSARADEELFIEFCEDFDYAPIIFTANQTVGDQRMPIYHTNVMMCIAETFVVICLESIDSKKERKNVVKHLMENGKEVIVISEEQMFSFAGNMLQVIGMGNKRYTAMSSAAFNSLKPAQIEAIEKHSAIVHSSLETIETCGGGSARCMMAEIFLPKSS